MIQSGKIKTLLSHHEPILLSLIDAKQHFGQQDASTIKVLALIRWKLMRLLRAYQHFKHKLIFDPIIAEADRARAARAADLKARCVALATDYEQHVKRWSLCGPMQAWDEYVEEASVMSNRIEAHLLFEADQVRKLLMPLGHDPF